MWSDIVRDLMKEQDVTQRELARRCEVSRSSVRRFLNGEGRATVCQFEKMLDALGYELDIMVKRTTGKAVH